MEVLISAADVIDDFVFILDERANIIFANKYAQKKLGYTLEEISKMNVLEVHPEPLRGEALSIVQDMLAGKSKFCPLPLVTKNNKHIPVETRVKYITIDGKQYLFGISKDMTEQYKANEKFIKAFDSNPSPMAISKIETGEYINVNRAFINTLGYAKHEIIGRKSTELKILQNTEREMLLKLIKEKGSIKDEAVDIIIKNGEIRNGLFSADIIEIDGEEYLLSILFDITEKITKEKKLKENEKKLQTIFDNFNTGISVTDEEGNIIDCNKASETILGVTKKEHLTRNYVGKEWKILREDLSIMPSDEYPSVSALKEGRVVNDVVMGVEKSDSTISWINVSAVPMELEGYGVMISYVDITARKQIEKELRDSEESFRNMFDNHSAVMLLIEPETGKILESNKAASSFYGYKKSELCSMDISEINIMNREKGFENLKNAKMKSKNFFEFSHKLSNGEVRMVEVHSSPIDFQGKTILFSIIHDISEKKQTEIELITAREEADRAALAKSQFLSNMSHEIRTPLNGIIGMIDVLKYTNLENEQKKIVRNIENASEKLLHVVNEVLDYSKLASEKQEVIIENYDIRKSFEKLSSIFKANIKKNIEICFFVSEKVPEILETDSVKIEKILINLIGNAIKFTKNGEITIAARAEMKKDLECLVKISVEDTGIGIPNDKIDALFTSFMQADESISRIYGGTGLGLAISKQLAELINGTIKVQSKKGVGSKFELEVTMKIIEPRRKIIPVYDAVVFCFGESKISSLVLEMISEYNVESSEASDVEELAMLSEMYLKENKRICVIVENISLEELYLAYEKTKESQDKIKIFYFEKKYNEQEVEYNPIRKEITLINGGFSQEVIKNILEHDNFNHSIEKTAEIEFEKIESELEDEKLKVIIIEDDEISRDAILTMAKILKVNPVEFSNSFEAINYFERNVVDLVLTDIQLPDISGFEVVRILRKIDSKRDKYTPIIAVSANSGREYKEKSINLGMDDYLGKPFKIEELYKIIVSHTRTSKKKAIFYKEEMEKDFKEEYIKAKALPELIKLYNKSKKLMIDALKKEDFQFLRREVHKLMGSFGVAGKNEISKKFEILEEDIEKMDVAILDEISSLLIETKKR